MGVEQFQGQSMEIARQALEKVGLKLERMEPLVEGLKPVGTAFKINDIPLSVDRSLEENIAQALEQVVTPQRHKYSVVIRFKYGGYAPDVIAEWTEKGLQQTPANCKKAVEVAIREAREYGNVDFHEGFRSTEVWCFPYEWDWGKNPGEDIFGG